MQKLKYLASKQNVEMGRNLITKIKLFYTLSFDFDKIKLINKYI